MNDREFYLVILGLAEPWEVKEVKVDAEGQKVEVRVGYRAGTLWACPESRERLPVHDHVERSWRHLDTCQFETVLVCRVPRLRLVDGKVWTVPVPWAEKGSRFTLLFERLAVTVLQMARSVKQAADWLRLDWDAVQRILERAVERGLARRELAGLKHLGLDEKSFRRGQNYIPSCRSSSFGTRLGAKLPFAGRGCLLALPPIPTVPLRLLGGRKSVPAPPADTPSARSATSPTSAVPSWTLGPRRKNLADARERSGWSRSDHLA